MEDPREGLRAAASTQDGQFATAQARELGLTYSSVRGLAVTGETVAVRRGVWRFRAATGDPDPAVTAYLACWPNAVVSHRSAAIHHGLRRVSAPPQPEVTVPHDHPKAPRGIRVYRSRDLAGMDVIRVGDVRYTSLARTACDLADADDRWETLALLDDVVAAGARPRWIHQRASALVNGRAGVRLLRDATRPGAADEFRSWLERAAGLVYRVGALPDPEWNVEIRDEAGRIGIVDALRRPWRVISEKEGLRFHTTPRQRRADARRFNRLGEAGYGVRRFTWQDVVHTPVEVVETVARALRAAGADVDLGAIPRRIEVPGRPF